MIVAICGKQGSGKSSVANALFNKLNNGVDSLFIKHITTRPIRNSSETFEYIFVDDERYNELSKNDILYSDCSYNTKKGVWKYAINKDDIHTALFKNKIGIIPVSPTDLENLINDFGKEKVLPVFIEVSDDLRKKRLESRTDKKETKRREKDDKKIFEEIKNKCIIINGDYDIDTVTNNIIATIHAFLSVTKGSDTNDIS